MCTISALTPDDLDEADRIMNVAFGTHLRVPDPATCFGDKDYVRTRFGYTRSFAARSDGRLVGTNFATVWGSFGFFGPLSVDPAQQGTKAGQALVAATMDYLRSAARVTHLGLFTFAESPKHLHLYEKFGFRPRFLTCIMELPLSPGPDDARADAEGPAGSGAAAGPDLRCFSAVQEQEAACAERFLSETLAITSGHILPGLDLRGEIAAVHAQGLGETLAVDRGFAVLHAGPGTEAGGGACYVKFAAARDAVAFAVLLDAVARYARGRGLGRVQAGVSTARVECYEAMKGHGYRTAFTGVAMEQRVAPAADVLPESFNRPGVFVLDDWR